MTVALLLALIVVAALVRTLFAAIAFALPLGVGVAAA